MLIRKSTYYLEKEWSFQQLLSFSLILMLLELFIRSHSISTPIGLLYPAILYSISLILRGKDVRLTTHFYLLLPFLAYSIGYIILLFSKNQPYKNAIWLQWYAAGYLVYSFSVVLFVATISRYYEYNANLREKLLVRKLTFIMLMGTIIVSMILYIDDSNINEDVDYLLQPVWLMFVLLVISILLHIEYLYNKRNNKNVVNLPDTPSDRIIERILTCFLRLLEEEKYYLRDDFDKSMLAKSCKVYKKDVDYFFTTYLEKDFKAFIIEYRISHALQLIKEKGHLYTLETIAHESGYKSQQTFIMHFKMVVGELPSNYVELK